MNNLINIKNLNGMQTVSAKELYLGLGLNKTNWSRWYPTNLTNSDYFKEAVDWCRVRHNDEGNETTDFAISTEFAKHIAMMARTEKSHQYRNYFLECEKQIKQIIPQLSPELQSIFELDKRTTETNTRIDKLENTMPLFNVECKELQALVKKIGVKALGGYRSPAYKDNSLRTKVYKDIQSQLKREFGVQRYEAIKRGQIESASGIVSNYILPLFLKDDITLFNNQVEIPFGDYNE